MKAIRTEWNGYEFRSRLEARWAVVFTALRISYEYEPEGYRLDDGACYLPDFLLHDIVGIGDLYVEVKGRMTEADRHKIEQFSRHKPIYVVGDIPYTNTIKACWNQGIHDASLKSKTDHFFSFKYVDGRDIPAYIGIYNNGKAGLFDVNTAAYAHEWVMNAAFMAAKSAHFEHGERPEDALGYSAAQECIDDLKTYAVEKQKHLLAKCIEIDNKTIRLNFGCLTSEEKYVLASIMHPLVIAEAEVVCKRVTSEMVS